MLTKNQEKGFTLLELTISIAVLSIGLLAVAGMVHTVMNVNRQSEHLTTAVNLVQAKIDELRVGDYTNILDETEYDLDENGDAGSGIFDRAVSVSESFTPAVKIIEVSVNWSDKNSRSVNMRTMLAGP
jgi:prepilin-type N-terminal cleavage/methylation domain-containing protein